MRIGNIGNILKIIILAYFFIAIYFQLNVGYADNGDFDRIMRIFTSGPVGFDENWPSPDSEEWKIRFFNYYLPYWKFDLPLELGKISSVIFLWLPGIVLNYYFYSSKIINLQLMSTSMTLRC